LGVMDRLVLSDAAWEGMAPLIIGRPDQKGSTGRDNRMFVEGGCGGGAGCASRYRARIGSSVSFRQNLGAPISFRHAAFQ
jgi:hypothetical protein